DNPNPDSSTEAALTMSYSFALVNVQAQERLVRRLFRMRTSLEALHFREGQCGDNALPQSLHDFEIAPPQTTGIQPFWLLERPAVTIGAASDPHKWGWGLSSLRISLRYTDKAAGVIGAVGSADSQQTVWWQAVSQRVQFRSALNSN